MRPYTALTLIALAASSTAATPALKLAQTPPAHRLSIPEVYDKLVQKKNSAFEVATEFKNQLKSRVFEYRSGLAPRPRETRTRGPRASRPPSRSSTARPRRRLHALRRSPHERRDEGGLDDGLGSCLAKELKDARARRAEVEPVHGHVDEGVLGQPVDGRLDALEAAGRGCAESGQAFQSTKRKITSIYSAH